MFGAEETQNMNDYMIGSMLGVRDARNMNTGAEVTRKRGRLKIGD